MSTIHIQRRESAPRGRVEAGAEFIGRFPIITFLQELDHATLLRILTEPRNALVRQYKQLFAYQGVTLEVSAAARSFVADQALARKTGARGLRAVLEAALQQTMFDMPSKPLLRACVLDLLEDAAGQRLTVRETHAVAGAEEPPVARLLPEAAAQAPLLSLDL